LIKQARQLEGVDQTQGIDLVWSETINAVAIEIYISPIRSVNTKNGIEQGTLTTAIRAHQAANAPLFDIQAYTIDSVNPTKVLADFSYS